MNLLPLLEFAVMVIVDVIFLLGLYLLMHVVLWRKSALAVMRRNYFGYFSNPTGYVFLCLFVLLTSFAAFWPHEFFTTNLANFDQLNKFLPYIMLVFIPAITMSIWAEERRQGTDELLLTLPAHDFDIVIGKYIAALFVFTVSLFFSQLSNYGVLILMTGGQLDTGLLFSTYLGYWFVGIAMLSVGMVASFLTNNLTVGFIFGAAFNAPLAFFSNADVIFSNSTWVQRLFEWSLLQRFEPFGRGLVSLPSALYFLGIAALGIYLSMILIGRRHWLGGRDGTSMLWHYCWRAVFVLAIVIGLVLIGQHSPLNRARLDVSREKVSTLSESTIELLSRLAAESQDKSKPPIRINAYVSNNTPTEFVQTKYDLINLLREFDVLGGNRVQVNLHLGIEPFSEEAIRAERRFGIRPTKVVSQSRGALREEDVVLGAAFTSGLERVVIPFMPYGTPVEYELMRSINTVSKSRRKTLGVVQTDAFVMGAVIRSQGQSARIPRLLIIEELQKQYDVELLEAMTPIALWLESEQDQPTQRRYDVLLAVQPSKMNPAELDNLIAAIQTGQPTIIFEDPFPSPENFPHVRGTTLPRHITRQSIENCDIQKLWQALDMDIDRVQRGEQVIPYLVWNSDKPYKRDSTLDLPERVLIYQEDRNVEPRFADIPATRGIDELYFPFTGYLRPFPDAKLEFVELVTTGFAGRILMSDFVGAVSEEMRAVTRGSATQQFVLAAWIRGPNLAAQSQAAPAVPQSKENTNVIYVCDIDMLADYFVEIRDYPIRNGIQYRFQNWAFVLNLIDSLADEPAYLNLRTREVRHSTLRLVENTVDRAMQEVYEATNKYEKELTNYQNKIQSEAMDAMRPLTEEIQQMVQKQQDGGPIDSQALQAKQALLQVTQQEQQQKYQRKIEEMQNERQERLRSIQLDAELKIQQTQRWYKLVAVIIPPIPPLLVGLFVFTRRRLREREGISKARRLK